MDKDKKRILKIIDIYSFNTRITIKYQYTDSVSSVFHKLTSCSILKRTLGILSESHLPSLELLAPKLGQVILSEYSLNKSRPSWSISI